MKIGILTQPLHANYGGLLQNFALQQVLRDAGHEVTTLDWDWVFNLSTKEKIGNLIRKLMCALKPAKKINDAYHPTKEEFSIIWRNTNRFIDTYIRRTDVITSEQGFAQEYEQGGYEAMVVGSDQCWRPCYNSFLSSMFLNFAKGDIKRVSYAASFGSDSWEFTIEQTREARNLVKRFDLVTVREDGGVDLCKRYLDIDAIQVLDPTLLLDKTVYENIAKKCNTPKSKGNLFTYILDPNEKKSQIVENIESASGLIHFDVLPICQSEVRTKDDIKNRIEDCVYPGVEVWLQAFMDAKMTIVDSFHGMVFSIIFNKPFWVIGNKERGLNRFTSLLKYFNLEDRLLYGNEVDNLDLLKPINWHEVNIKLSEGRRYSKQILLNALD